MTEKQHQVKHRNHLERVSWIPKTAPQGRCRNPCIHWAGTQTGGLHSAHGLPPTRPSKRRQAAGEPERRAPETPPPPAKTAWKERSNSAGGLTVPMDKRSTKQRDQESEAQAKLGVDGRERTVDPGLSPHTYSQLVSHSLPATTRWGRY